MSMFRSAASALVAGVLLVSCATGSEPAAETPAGSATTAASSLAPGAPSPAVLTKDALLPPDSMPEWNGAVVWESTADPTEVLMLCPAPSMADLGALSEISRAYVWPEGGMAGVNTVGVFDSPEASGAAAAELRAAVAQCPDLTPISDSATGSTWTTGAVVDAESGDARFEFLGVADAGALVTVVAFTLTGQDANWEMDPIIDSLRASVALLEDRG